MKYVCSTVGGICINRYSGAQRDGDGRRENERGEKGEERERERDEDSE